MFGFLKKKLQQAIARFSKGAKAVVKEERIEEKALIEAAKREEEQLLREEVEEIPETPRQRAQHEREEIEWRTRPAEQVRQVPPGVVPKPELRPKEVAARPKIEKPVIKERPSVAEKPSVEKPVVPVVIPEKIVPVTPRINEQPVVEVAAPEAPRGLFAKLKETFTKKTLSPDKFDQLFWDLEVTLLENNVALEVIEKLKADLKQALTSGKVSRLGVEELILLSLRRSVEEVLSIPGFDLVRKVKQSTKRPYVIAFIGVNGSGKTTTLAKVANLFQTEGLSVVMAASDTFRAAAIDQLKVHADKLGVKLISQGYGADPAAVAYDAIEHAKAKSIDVVMIDTAGRLHSNTNLMAELQKVVRVSQPDLKIFIGESITGNDCVEQAKEFQRLVGIDAIILSKADVDEKGGAALSISYITKKPILYLGIGQAYGDLKEFDKEEIVRGLGL
jgi:fused signal recognition particle receptor